MGGERGVGVGVGEGRSKKKNATLQTWRELQKEVPTPESKFFQSLLQQGDLPMA